VATTSSIELREGDAQGCHRRTVQNVLSKGEVAELGKRQRVGERTASFNTHVFAFGHHWLCRGANKRCCKNGQGAVGALPPPVVVHPAKGAPAKIQIGQHGVALQELAHNNHIQPPSVLVLVFLAVAAALVATATVRAAATATPLFFACDTSAAFAAFSVFSN
jgi:hypothetical protein